MQPFGICSEREPTAVNVPNRLVRPCRVSACSMLLGAAEVAARAGRLSGEGGASKTVAPERRRSFRARCQCVLQLVQAEHGPAVAAAGDRATLLRGGEQRIEVAEAQD